MASPSDSFSPPKQRVPFKRDHPPQTSSSVKKLRPDADPAKIDAVAQIWDEVVHHIIGEMMELGMYDESPLHINVRADMTLELAQLQLWLAERVVEKRLADRKIEEIDIDTERAECLGERGFKTIKGTAQMVFERIWTRKMEERWKPKSAKASERDNNPNERKLSIKPVNKNHFIPKWLIRDIWSNNSDILRWRITPQGWISRRRSFGKWGFRRNLYNDRLEAYAGLIEGDAKNPIVMLLQTKPLNRPQQVSLIGFYVVQILRSPFFRERLQQEILSIIEQLPEFDGAMKRPDMSDGTYQMLRQSDDFYHKLAGPLMWSRWAIVRSKSPVFILPDAFCARTELGKDLRIIVPLTPTACFVTLPSEETEKRVVPLNIKADERLASRISSLLMQSAAEEFLSHQDFRIGGDTEIVGISQLLKEIENTAREQSTDRHADGLL